MSPPVPPTDNRRSATTTEEAFQRAPSESGHYPTMAMPDPITEHARSSVHREVVLRAEAIGCFYCLRFSSPSEILDWVDEDDAGVGRTALCPRCGIDAVVPVRDGIDGEFLRRMHDHWFSTLRE